MFIQVFSLFGIEAFSFGESIKDPILSQTEWKGTCLQNCMQPYEMVMKINERKRNEINGTLEWPLVKCRTQFKGYITDCLERFSDRLNDNGKMASKSFFLEDFSKTPMHVIFYLRQGIHRLGSAVDLKNQALGATLIRPANGSQVGVGQILMTRPVQGHEILDA